MRAFDPLADMDGLKTVRFHLGFTKRHRESDMSKSATALLLGLFLCPVLSVVAQAQSTITEQEAHSIRVDAYLYFYPLISMDITRLVSTNIEAGKEPMKGPANTFLNAASYPPADLKVVVRYNFGTLYSLAFLDMTKEAVVVPSPDASTECQQFMWQRANAPGSQRRETPCPT